MADSLRTPGVALAHILKSRRILVAQDNAVSQKVTVLLLAKLGCRADVVSDGEEAARVFAALPFDAVLLDVELPKMNGFETVRAIRAGETDGRRTPIIAMTENAPEDDLEECLAAGMDDCVAKPLRLEVLSDALLRWLVPAPVDLAHFRKEMEEAGCLEDSDEVIRIFLQTSPQRVRSLQEAAAAGDVTAAGAAAHALKGSLRVLEAHHGADQCERLEVAGRQGDIEAVRAGMDTFVEEFGRVTAFLEHALATNPVV